MASIQGIGGVFIESNNAQRLAEWYQNVLGIEMEAHPEGIGYFRVFPSRDADSGILRENPVFAINQARERILTSGSGFTLNLRVDHLFPYLDQLKEQGVAIEENILQWERGRHAWIRDLDGNRVELYEEILVDEA